MLFSENKKFFDGIIDHLHIHGQPIPLLDQVHVQLTGVIISGETCQIRQKIRNIKKLQRFSNMERPTK